VKMEIWLTDYEIFNVTRNFTKGSMSLVRIVLLVSVWFSGRGQVTDSSRYHFVLSSTGIINRTNTVRTNVFNNNFQADVNNGKFSFNTAVSWIYGKQNKMKSNDDYYSVRCMGIR
jgi:hypothetical protein